MNGLEVVIIVVSAEARGGKRRGRVVRQRRRLPGLVQRFSPEV